MCEPRCKNGLRELQYLICLSPMKAGIIEHRRGGCDQGEEFIWAPQLQGSHMPACQRLRREIVYSSHSQAVLDRYLKEELGTLQEVWNLEGFRAGG